MSGVKAAAGCSINNDLATNIQPPPKKIVNQEIPRNEFVPVRLASEDLSNALSARAGLDAGDILKAKVNALIDQAQEAVTQLNFKPSDIAGPVILDRAKMVENAKNLVQDAKELGAKVWQTFQEESGEPKVPDLDENDSYRINSKTSVAVEVGVGVEFSYEIKCTKKTPDPDNPGKFISEYSVTGEISPEAKIALGITELSEAPGAKIEYKFKTEEELKIFLKVQQRDIRRAALVLDKNTGKVPVVTPEEEALVESRISSIELRNDVGAEFDAKIGLKDAVEIGTNPAVKIRNGLKIEFEDGQPTNLVRTVEVSGGIDKLGLQVPFGKNGAGDIGVKAKILEGKHTLTFETKVPIDSTKTSDIARLISDPLGSTQLEKAETTIKYVREEDYGKAGTQFEMEVSDLSAEETKQIAKSLTAESPYEALKNVRADVKTKTSVFTDDGLNYGIDIAFKGYGFETRSLAEKRDVTIVSQSDQKDVGL